jgi:hypothetical protein
MITEAIENQTLAARSIEIVVDQVIASLVISVRSVHRRSDVDEEARPPPRTPRPARPADAVRP